MLSKLSGIVLSLINNSQSYVITPVIFVGKLQTEHRLVSSRIENIPMGLLRLPLSLTYFENSLSTQYVIRELLGNTHYFYSMACPKKRSYLNVESPRWKMLPRNYGADGFFVV